MAFCDRGHTCSHMQRLFVKALGKLGGGTSMTMPVVTRAPRAPRAQSQEGTSGDLDFQIVVIFCLIGLLLTLYVAARFPELGVVFTQYNQM